MEILRVEPLELPLSRLALGTLGFSPATRDRDYAVLDAWVEAGGTVIDTAHVYEGGDAERVLGEWLRDRPGVRERLVIVTKGAHPDGDRVRVTPADIASDLSDSIERLGGPVDLYLLHRDDPAVDVGELVDALDAHRRAGDIARLRRLQLDARRGSTRRTRTPPPAASRASAATARTCRSRSRTSRRGPAACPRPTPSRGPGTPAPGMPLLAWSAQAGGFFAG